LRGRPAKRRRGGPKTLPTTLPAILEALRNAGATEEIIAAAVKAGGEFENAPPRQNGRRRKYADGPARQRAYRRRYETQAPRDATLAPRYHKRYETSDLRARLGEVAVDTVIAVKGFFWLGFG
jgi:hypothetical protein